MTCRMFPATFPVLPVSRSSSLLKHGRGTSQPLDNTADFAAASPTPLHNQQYLFPRTSSTADPTGQPSYSQTSPDGPEIS
mmetsp:Transcript_11233/g.30639  ORF Transcript_11233/g.30639 Transcript_11233/m.30639 type:complete len:80 (-) Transcript_11233:720-959(-)